jgi:DNA-binding NtrC family response regulator
MTEALPNPGITARASSSAAASGALLLWDASASRITCAPARAWPCRLAALRQPVREVDPISALLNKPITLAELEDRYIEGVLRSADGNKQRAAESLGVDLSTLYRRTKRS